MTSSGEEKKHTLMVSGLEIAKHARKGCILCGGGGVFYTAGATLDSRRTNICGCALKKFAKTERKRIARGRPE